MKKRITNDMDTVRYGYVESDIIQLNDYGTEPEFFEVDSFEELHNN